LFNFTYILNAVSLLIKLFSFNIVAILLDELPSGIIISFSSPFSLTFPVKVLYVINAPSINKINSTGIIIIIFFFFLLLNSFYLNWNYNDPKQAVFGVLFHSIEWIFVRIAPVILAISIVGIVLIKKQD